jgi:hypothetical protein
MPTKYCFCWVVFSIKYVNLEYEARATYIIAMSSYKEPELKEPEASQTSSIGALTSDEVRGTDIYSDRLREVVSSFEIFISKLSDAYVNHKLFPTNTEYENVYNRLLSNITIAKSNMFELQNEIEVKTADYREKVAILSSNIKEDRHHEDNLVKDFEQAEDSGAAGARKILTDTYKLQYASNFFMVLGICIGLVILYKVFSPTTRLPDNITDNLPSINNPLADN